MKRVWRWKASDALECLRERVKREVAADHYDALILWALTAPHQKDPPKPPKEPAILR